MVKHFPGTVLCCAVRQQASHSNKCISKYENLGKSRRSTSNQAMQSADTSDVASRTASNRLGHGMAEQADWRHRHAQQDAVLRRNAMCLACTTAKGARDEQHLQPAFIPCLHGNASVVCSAHAPCTATAPSRYISRAANRLTASRCTQREAALSQRENRVQMPAMLGMNCGLRPAVRAAHSTKRVGEDEPEA